MRLVAMRAWVKGSNSLTLWKSHRAGFWSGGRKYTYLEKLVKDGRAVLIKQSVHRIEVEIVK